LVNVPKEKGEYLKSLNPNLEITHDYLYFLNDAMMRGYCTNRKPSIMKELMTKSSYPVVWIDADSVFTRNDQELYNILIKSDLCTILDHIRDNCGSAFIFNWNTPWIENVNTSLNCI
jgi:hypothetical protein